MLIKSYGMFWSRADVFWGKGGQSGALLGRSVSAKRGPDVEFWDQIGIYVLYSGFEIVYVGQAGSGASGLGRRLRQHTKGALSSRWDSFSWFGTRGVLQSGRLSMETLRSTSRTPQILDVLEGVLIATTEPRLNRQGPKLRTGGVHQYSQVRDERLGESTDSVIAATREEIERVRQMLESRE